MVHEAGALFYNVIPIEHGIRSPRRHNKYDLPLCGEVGIHGNK